MDGTTGLRHRGPLGAEALKLAVYSVRRKNLRIEIHRRTCPRTPLSVYSAYLLLLFCGLAYSCGSAEYEINRECCPMCTPGTRVYKHCTEYTSTSCVPCTQKSFTDVPNGLSHCLPCIVCDPAMGLKTERECTPTSDTVCGPLDHHYCTKTVNKGCSFAQKHTICRPGQFIRHNGTTSTNAECGYCPDKTFSNKSFSAYCKPHTDCQSLGLQEMTAGTNTSDSECGPRNIHVSIIIVPVLLALAVILTIIFILWWRKQNMVHKKQTEGERNDIELSQDAGLEERQEPISACSEQETGEQLGQVASPLQGLHDTIYPHTHTYRLICLSLDCWKKPKYPEDTHMDMERKCKHAPHRKVPTRS